MEEALQKERNHDVAENRSKRTQGLHCWCLPSLANQFDVYEVDSEARWKDVDAKPYLCFVELVLDLVGWLYQRSTLEGQCPKRILAVHLQAQMTFVSTVVDLEQDLLKPTRAIEELGPFGANRLVWRLYLHIRQGHHTRQTHLPLPSHHHRKRRIWLLPIS